MKLPKALVFDMGEVLIDLNLEAVHQGFVKLGIEDIFFKMEEENTPLFHNFERGTISEDTFFEDLGAYLKIDNKNLLIDNWNLFLGNLKPNTLETLQKLNGTYRIFLLSNTNKTHVNYIKEKIPNGKKLFTFFETIFFSHEVGMRKPDAEIYQYVVEQIGVSADEILFVDDLKENIDSAKKIGIHGIVFQGFSDISKLNLV